MGLLEELINKRANAYELRGTFIEKRDGFVRAVETQDELIADLDRAISALSPAPSEGDALGEFMKREGAVRHDGGPCPVARGTKIEAFIRGAVIGDHVSQPQIDQPEYWHDDCWHHAAGADHILAYRIISAPSEEAWKGEDAPEIPEGFTKWEGGGIAVGDNVHVEVISRTGHKWESLGNEIVWSHVHEDDDIIAYRVLPSEPAAEAKGEEESVPVSIEHEERWPFAISYTAVENVFGSGGYETLESAQADFRRFKSDERILTIVLKQDGEVLETFARPFEPDTITISASEQHAEESAAAFDPWAKARAQGDGGVSITPEPAPLFPPEPPPAATPEQLIEAGAINGEAYGLWRKLATGRRPEDAC